MPSLSLVTSERKYPNQNVEQRRYTLVYLPESFQVLCPFGIIFLLVGFLRVGAFSGVADPWEI